jgi:DUF4097 and DUF4098 domain-containing protein YvlB
MQERKPVWRRMVGQRGSIPLTLPLCLACALLGIISGAWAQGELPPVKRGVPQRQGKAWVELADCGRFPVRPGAKLILRTEFGTVRAATAADNRFGCKVRISAYTADEAEAQRLLKRVELIVRRGDNEVYVTTGTRRHPETGDGSQSRLDAEFLLRVPLQFNLDLATEGGDIDVDNLDGELRAESGVGGIHTGNVTGPVRVETSGGSIALGNITRRLDARTAGGDIRIGDVKSSARLETSGGEIVAGYIGGEFNAQTAGGDIVLKGASGPVMVQTAGGEIQLGDCGATVKAQTAGGSIRLQGARGLVRAETAGGSIDLFKVVNGVRATTAAGGIVAEFNGDPRNYLPSRLETSVGDVQVFLPNDLPLDINAVIDDSAGHRIFSDFPLTVRGNSEQPFAQGAIRGQCLLNGGGKELDIHTVTGNIEIRRLDSQNLQQMKRRQMEFWNTLESREQRQLEQVMEKFRDIQREWQKEQKEFQLEWQQQRRDLVRHQEDGQKQLDESKSRRDQ